MACGSSTILVCMLLIFLIQTNPGSGALVKRSDDADLHTLHTLVNQQASALQTVQAKQAALEAKLSVFETKQTAFETKQSNLESDLETKTTAVAFSAHFSQDDENNGISLSPHATLKFDNVVTNIGNSYNPHTGIFTAPVKGAYAFLLSIMSTSKHGPIYVVIEKDGTVLDLIFAEGSGDIYDQGTGHVATHLTAGQQVWVQQHEGDAVRGGRYTIFTGFLVQAD